MAPCVWSLCPKVSNICTIFKAHYSPVLAECTTASLEILKKCLDGDGIHVDRVCLKEVHSVYCLKVQLNQLLLNYFFQNLTEVSMDNHDCFCGGLVKFSDMLTSVEALLCPDENQGRVGANAFFGNGADVFYGNYGYPYASPLPGQVAYIHKVWKPRCPSPPPLGGKNHATSYHIINCLLGRPNESGVSIPYPHISK